MESLSILEKQLKTVDGTEVIHNFIGSFISCSGTNRNFRETLVISNILAKYLEIPTKLDYFIAQFSDPQTFMGGEDGINNVFDELITHFERHKGEINRQTKEFSEMEIIRLNEALFTFHSNCYLSAIINCSVVLESRLLGILKKKNESYLKSKKPTMRFTLGELIRTYLNNKEEFQTIIPAKYDSLLETCNSYRTYSAHAKNEELNRNDAQAVLSMTFSFLLDERLIVGESGNV
jgi:hypothetical protein